MPRTSYSTTTDTAEPHARGRSDRRPVATSAGLGWSVVEVSRWAEQPVVAPLAIASSHAHRLVLVTSGWYRIESRHAAGWTEAAYGPGSVGTTAAGRESVLRWRSTADTPMRSLHVLIRPAVFTETADAFAVPGTPFPDALRLHEPRIADAARSLDWALQHRAPALHADAAGQVLVTQLVLAGAGAREEADAHRLSRPLLDRLIEYLHEHLADDVSLDDLSGVANLSKYHLLRRFKTSTGVPPHRFLQHLRMEHAATVLLGGDATIDLVAARCGYRSSSRFSAAFKRHFGTSPAAFRVAHRHRTAVGTD